MCFHARSDVWALGPSSSSSSADPKRRRAATDIVKGEAIVSGTSRFLSRPVGFCAVLTSRSTSRYFASSSAACFAFFAFSVFWAFYLGCLGCLDAFFAFLADASAAV